MSKKTKKSSIALAKQFNDISVQQFHALLDHNPDGIIVVSSIGKILFANRMASKLFAVDQQVVEAENHPEKNPLIGTKFNYELIDNDNLEIETKLGTFVEMRVVNSRWCGEAAFIVSLRDITAHKKLKEQLIYNANHDPLTGLANRNALEEALTHAVHNARRRHETFAVLMLDLDRFKLINDTLGHDAGDQLLKETAARLSAVIRESDILARTGGDEFVLVAENLGGDKRVDVLANKIISCMEHPFTLAGRHFLISTSIGIALFPKDGDYVSSLLKHADVAMYRSKQEGRNCFHFYDLELHKKTMESLTLESELKQALNKRQFLLHYQPLFGSDGIVGAEALLRWQHPQSGLIPPDKFIYLLERTGLIRETEGWIIEAACKQLIEWRKTISPNMHISVNVSASSLLDTTLPDTIAKLLTKYQVPGHCLEIEITENVLLRNLSEASINLNKLKDLGVGISLDDFGIGYSSLNYLMEFHAISSVKIDRAFILKIEKDPRAKIILSSVITLAHLLDMSVVAEGIETAEQFGLLREQHCDCFQGYYFSRPISPEKFNRDLFPH